MLLQAALLTGSLLNGVARCSPPSSSACSVGLLLSRWLCAVLLVGLVEEAVLQPWYAESSEVTLCRSCCRLPDDFGGFDAEGTLLGALLWPPPASNSVGEVCAQPDTCRQPRPSV